MKNLIALFLLLLTSAFKLSNSSATPDIKVYLGEQLIHGDSVDLDNIRSATFVVIRNAEGQELKLKSYTLTFLIRKVGLFQSKHGPRWMPLSTTDVKCLKDAAPGDLLQISEMVAEDLSNQEILPADVFCCLK
jgi:hypothetical protein